MRRGRGQKRENKEQRIKGKVDQESSWSKWQGSIEMRNLGKESPCVGNVGVRLKSQDASMDSITGISNAERAWSFFSWQSLGEAAWVACRLRVELAYEEGDEIKHE